MVYTALDNNATKVRIKAIIDADTTLVDENNPKNKLRDVIVGVPPGDDYNDLNHPALVITNAERWMEEKIRGPVIARVISSVDVIVRYDLILTVHKDQSNEAEKEVDRLFKLLEEALYKFANLQNPVDGTDPLCDSIVFTTTQRIPQFKGQEIDGFKTTMTVTIKSHD